MFIYFLSYLMIMITAGWYISKAFHENNELTAIEFNLLESYNEINEIMTRTVSNLY